MNKLLSEALAAAHEASPELSLPICDETYCEIYHQRDGNRFVWSIGAMPGADTEIELRAHLEKWMPGSVFLGYRFGDPSSWNQNESRGD
jgi:hypothetical protein